MMRDCQILVNFVLRCSRLETFDVFASFVEIALAQPVFGCRCFQTDVVAPAKPCVAIEDVFDFVKCGGGLLTLPGVCPVDPEID